MLFYVMDLMSFNYVFCSSLSVVFADVVYVMDLMSFNYVFCSSVSGVFSRCCLCNGLDEL